MPDVKDINNCQITTETYLGYFLLKLKYTDIVRVGNKVNVT